MKLTSKNATFLVTFVIFFSYCFISVTCDSTSGRSNPVASGKKIRTLSPSATRLFHILRLGMSGGIDDEDLQSDDDNVMQKRQYDDYGHMRFGKRTNPNPEKSFDDYGHLRFGKWRNRPTIDWNQEPSSLSLSSSSSSSRKAFSSPGTEKNKNKPSRRASTTERRMKLTIQ